MRRHMWPAANSHMRLILPGWRAGEVELFISLADRGYIGIGVQINRRARIEALAAVHPGTPTAHRR